MRKRDDIAVQSSLLHAVSRSVTHSGGVAQGVTRAPNVTSALFGMQKCSQ